MIQTTQPIRPLRQRMLEDMTLRKLSTLRQFEPTTVVMEACYTSHPWGRAIQALGHTVKLIPPYQVKPFVVGNKNDHNDAHRHC